MSDVEHWLTNLVTEVDNADATIEKESLCESFFAFMETNSEVGRDQFFSLLGNALLRVGYNKVKPVLKKGRRVAYTGMAFKKDCVSPPVSEQKKTAISAHTLQEWMMLNYCEGGPSETVAAEDLWLHFSENCSIKEDQKSVFCSLLGNVFRNPPFLKVRRQLTRSDKGGKISTFQNLRVNHRLNTSDECQIPGSSEKEGKDLIQDLDHQKKLCDNNAIASPLEPSMPRLQMENKVSCEVGPNLMGKENLTDERNSASNPMEVEVGSVDDIPDIQPPDCNFLGFKAETDLEKGEQNAVVVEGADNYVEEDEKSVKEGEKEESKSSVEEESSVSDQSDSDMSESADATSNPLCNHEEESSSSDALFRKYHKNINNLLPCHLPGRPTSFQSYLSSVFPDPSNFSVERQHIHSLSASTSMYKDARIRAFVSACFPPIKVGSFPGECDGFTFTGDVFPQFSHVGKSYFNCEICIPYCKWAIVNNHPYPSTRSKQASVDAILAGTAKLVFSGVVQMHEHSLSKCHVEAASFWRKESVPMTTVCPPVKKDEGRKEKCISDYFTKVSDPLN